MTRAATALPPALARRDNRVLRPIDAETAYAHPRAELARLAANGVVVRLANGYYAINPQDRLGDRRWRPPIEAVALGIAQADYGRDAVALAGVSAARHHGAIPRALAVAIVAVPKQRPKMVTTAGAIVFTKRDVTRLELERINTALTAGWVTTIEQTMLDLAARPTLGEQSAAEIQSTIRAMGLRADQDQIAELARSQHRPAALRTIGELIGAELAL